MPWDMLKRFGMLGCRYHTEMKRHGADSTLMLIPGDQERCFCVGNPGVQADQGSPYHNHSDWHRFPLFQSGAKFGFEMHFAASTFGAGDPNQNTCLESNVKNIYFGSTCVTRILFCRYSQTCPEFKPGIGPTSCTLPPKGKARNTSANPAWQHVLGECESSGRAGQRCMYHTMGFAGMLKPLMAFLKRTL